MSQTMKSPLGARSKEKKIKSEEGKRIAKQNKNIRAGRERKASTKGEANSRITPPKKMLLKGARNSNPKAQEEVHYPKQEPSQQTTLGTHE